MIVREEPFNEVDEKLLNKVYSKQIGSYWIGQIFIIIMAIIGPYIPKRRRDFPGNFEEYKYEFLTGLLIMTGFWIYYFYKTKSSLRKDLKLKIKELLSFEVLKKERFYEKKTFYVFIDNHRREEIGKELYDDLSTGDQVMYYQSKFSKEKLTDLFKNEENEYG